MRWDYANYSATKQLVNMAVNTNDLVYCDLIAPQFIGTAMARYLRTFKLVPSDYDSEYILENVYYVPVEKSVSRHTYRNTNSVGGADPL